MNLAQEMLSMRTVAEVQNALQGPATRYADLLFQLVTSEPKVGREVEAGDEATAVISTLQAVETRSASATTSDAQRFRCKEATEKQPLVWKEQ